MKRYPHGFIPTRQRRMLGLTSREIGIAFIQGIGLMFGLAALYLFLVVCMA